MRTTPVIAGVVLLSGAMLALSGCNNGNPLHPTPGSATGAQAVSANATPGEPGINSDLAAVRNATARFHDIDVAIAAGYRLPIPTEPCVASPAGTMGYHYVNQGLVDQMIDLLQPEALLYVPKKGGGLRLVAVEYLKPVLVSNGMETRPWFPAQQWTLPWVVFSSTPSLFGRDFDGPMAGHSPTMPWHWDLHAWAWAPNPSGDFMQFNPAVSCTP